LVETPDALVEAIREVAIEDTLLTHVTALLKDTSLSPNQAAVILAKDMPPYPLGALIDWLTEIQERMHRIIRKQQRGEAA
jgi:hypothetical protein